MLGYVRHRIVDANRCRRAPQIATETLLAATRGRPEPMPRLQAPPRQRSDPIRVHLRRPRDRPNRHSIAVTGGQSPSAPCRPKPQETAQQIARHRRSGDHWQERLASRQSTDVHRIAPARRLRNALGHCQLELSRSTTARALCPLSVGNSRNVPATGKIFLNCNNCSGIQAQYALKFDTQSTDELLWSLRWC